MKISDIFEKEPTRWGLRGDPFLWRELKQRFRDIDIPDTPDQLKTLIEREYELSTGHPVTYENDFVVDRFSSHGMSSGCISPEFWVTAGIPLLVSRHEELNMYYDRTLSEIFSQLLEPKGSMRWLYDYVKGRDDLDFLIGKAKEKEWISIYRGLSRVLTVRKTANADIVKLDAADAYRELDEDLYARIQTSENFCDRLDKIVKTVASDAKFKRYYKNKKEGYYQNELSRRYGILGLPSDKFVIIDKEAVIGYKNEKEKAKLYKPLHEKYKELQQLITKAETVRTPADLPKKAIGNELDFLALNQDGELLLIEYKHGTNTSGIYLSPLQIGMYFDLFNDLPRRKLEEAIFTMLEQKQKIGLINPNWKKPKAIKTIVPVLMISNFNKGSAKTKYQEVLKLVRAEKGKSFLSNIRTYNYTTEDGIKPW